MFRGASNLVLCIILVLHEKLEATDLDETLSSILPPEAKPLAHWSPGFTEVPLSTLARFTDGSAKLKPSGIH